MLPAEILKKINDYRPEKPMIFRELFCYFVLLRSGYTKKYSRKNAIYWANPMLLKTDTWYEESMSSSEIEFEEIFEEDF
jgi:hypothetical protein